MKKTTFTAMIALAFVSLLTSCDSSSGVSIPPPPPPPAPLVWDQANWDEVLWQ